MSQSSKTNRAFPEGVTPLQAAEALIALGTARTRADLGVACGPFGDYHVCVLKEEHKGSCKVIECEVIECTT